MIQKSKQLPFWVIVAAVFSIAVLSLVLAQPTPEPNKNAPANKMETQKEPGDMRSRRMQSNMAACSIEISNVKKAVENAIAAIDKLDPTTARRELEEAEKILTNLQIKMQQQQKMMQRECANDRCPITGKDIEQDTEFSRMHKGMKVCFCCPACPPQWDKLSDEEKDAKLQAVTPSDPNQNQTQ